jgi:muconolactone delta-isomerase
MRFIVEGSPSQPLSDELMARLPEESARGRELDAQGLRQALYVAADMSRVWQIFAADSEADVRRALESLPLYAVTTYIITPLAEM